MYVQNKCYDKIKIKVTVTTGGCLFLQLQILWIPPSTLFFEFILSIEFGCFYAWQQKF